MEEARTDITIARASSLKKVLGRARLRARPNLSLKQREIQIIIDLHKGRAAATVWTCDLSYDILKLMPLTEVNDLRGNAFYC